MVPPLEHRPLVGAADVGPPDPFTVAGAIALQPGRAVRLLHGAQHETARHSDQLARLRRPVPGHPPPDVQPGQGDPGTTAVQIRARGQTAAAGRPADRARSAIGAGHDVGVGPGEGALPGAPAGRERAVRRRAGGGAGIRLALGSGSGPEEDDRPHDRGDQARGRGREHQGTARQMGAARRTADFGRHGGVALVTLVAGAAVRVRDVLTVVVTVLTDVVIALTVVTVVLGERPQPFQQLVKTGPRGRFLAQAVGDRVPQRPGHRVQRRGLVHHVIGGHIGAVRVERALAGRRVHQHRRQREHIGLRPDLARIAQLLRRHERGRAHDPARHGQRLVVGRPGDAEVDDAGALVGQHDVGRFQIPVHHPRPVDVP